MIINLVPVRMDAELKARLDGEVLTLNGQKLDLSGASEEAPLTAEALGCPWIVGEVTREAGEIVVSVLLPHAADAPEETRFPEPIQRKKAGELALPPASAAAAPEAAEDLTETL